MDSNLEYLKSVKLGKYEVGVLIGLNLIACGLAIDLREDDDYYFSVTLALVFISFNICKPKSKFKINKNSSAE